MSIYEESVSASRAGRQELTLARSRASRVLVVAGHARSLVNFRGPLLCALRDRGLVVHVAAPQLSADPALFRILADWGVTCHDIPLQRAGLSPFQDLRGLVTLCQLLRRVAPDTLLAYTIKPVIYASLAGWIVRVPRRFALITGMGYAFTDEPGGRRAWVQRLVVFLYGLSLRRTHRVFFQNPDDEAHCRELELLPKRVPSQVVNGSGVDLDHFAPVPLPEGAPVFLLIARLIADKGIRQYVEAARRVKRLHGKAYFLLVGGLDDNPESIRRDELEAWCREGVIEYLGRLDDVRPAMARASVFVLPTYYREGTPRTVLEAMAMGRAIITSDAPGCRETVQDGENGYLVPVREPEALALAMQRFLDEPGLARRMGDRSRQIAEHKYDVHLVNADMLEGMEL
ncbi:glycosyltransferase family 4 protein [Halomonas sp. C05BenzN]|uniref:glycosyltransferase family 4 protein n=1 Tax=Halomonas sp. C05BenzN TaxID=3411041 RepID=UPI003B92C55C